MRKFMVVVVVGLCLTSCKTKRERASELIREGMTAYSEQDYAKSVKYFKAALRLRPDNAAIAYNIACGYALLKEKDSALNYLEKAVELGLYKIGDDPDLAILQDDPRYMELTERAAQLLEELKSKEWEPVIVLPKRFDTSNVYPLVIGLHGFGSNPVDFADGIGPYITRLGYILCCPYAPDVMGKTAFAWGHPYELAEQRIMEAYEYVKSRYKIDTTNVIILGYSQGGSRAFFTGLRHPEIFGGIITMAGAYKEEFNQYLGDAKTKGMKIYMMIGAKDFLLETNKTAKDTMDKLGIPVKLMVYPKLGHAAPPGGEIIKALKWLQEQ